MLFITVVKCSLLQLIKNPTILVSSRSSQTMDQQQQQQEAFIKDLVSRRDDKTRIVSCLPLDRPGSSASKLTDSPFGIRFGYSENATSSSTQQQKLNSARSVLGAFVEPRGVLESPSLLCVETDLLQSHLGFSAATSDQKNNNNKTADADIISISKQLRSQFEDLTWFFCPTNSQLRDENSFWQTQVDRHFDDQDEEDSNKHHLPYALCYTGMQFGIQAPQLGDGRLLTLAECSSSSPDKHFELQVKGGGIKTPYSRGLDGLLTLQSALKEWMLSKVCRKVGIPVCEVLAVFKENGRECFRDISASNHNNPSTTSKGPREYIDEQDDQKEKGGEETTSNSKNDDEEDTYAPAASVSQPCAVLVRLCTSSIRVGTFDYLVKTKQWKLMQKLLLYLDRVHFGDSNNDASNNSSRSAKKEVTDKFLMSFLEKVTQRSAELVAKWQAQGFCHGVLNTDNILLVGETIDLATGCFIRYFDDEFTQNPDDIANAGMYRFGKQPQKYFEACERLSFLFYAFYASIHSGSPDQNHVRILRVELSKIVAETFQSVFTKTLNAEVLKKIGIVSRCDALAAVILKTLKQENPAIDDFFEELYEKVSTSSYETSSSSKTKRRDREGENNNDGTIFTEILEVFEKEKKELIFEKNKSSVVTRRDCTSLIKFEDVLVGSSNLNQDREVIEEAFKKAQASAFPMIRKTYQEAVKGKEKYEDCGCG